MNLIKIPCPDCSVVGSFSLVDRVYEGPYKCWKCRKLFKIRIENNQVQYCEPITDEEFTKLQELHEMRKKFKGEE